MDGGQQTWITNDDMEIDNGENNTNNTQSPASTTNNPPPTVSVNTPLLSADFLSSIMQQTQTTAAPVANAPKVETIGSDKKDERPVTAAIRKEIEEWRKKNDLVQLNVLHINDGPEYNIQCVIGPDSIPFQLYANENWQPMFILSESSQLEDYILPLNAQIEEQSKTENPVTISALLNLLGAAFNITPPKPPVSTHAHNFFTNFPAARSMSEEEEEKVVDPTAEDWDNLILPEVKKALEKENFQKYEIDEWLRRVQVQIQRGDYKKALSIIRDDIMGGAQPPQTISHFFPKYRWRRPASPEKQEKTYIETGGTQEATSRLRAELEQLKEMNTKELGFTAEPINNHLYHWHVSLFGFGQTQLGQDLTEWSLKHMQISDQTKEIQQEILLEMKFPSNWPAKSPHFRIIKPRFKNIEVELTLSSNGSESTTTISSSIIASKSEEDIAMPDVTGRKSLSVSRAIEKSKDSWVPSSIAELIQQIRSFFLESGAKIDVDSPLEGYSLPTIGGFWRTFKSANPKSVSKPELENSGKIILPVSVLEELSQFDLENSGIHYFSSPYGSLAQSGSLGTGPILFELSTGKGKRSFCGVEEFTGNEGSVVVPEWIMSNLGVSEGFELEVRRVSLPRGTYVKLQPHTAEFLQVEDPKAMLEWVLPKFVVLTVGDTIVIPFRDKKYSFNVLEVKPGRAVHIVDSEITTEFSQPLNGDIGFTASTSTSTSQSKQEEKSTSTSQSTPTKGETTGRLESGVEGVDFKICDNCKQRIPLGAYTTHSLTCARMNWFCDTCQMPVQRSKKDEHMQEFHKTVTCECGSSMESRLLAAHKAKECPKRTVRCEYCQLQMPYDEKIEHETKCGSQTEKCEICKRYIQRKDLPFHMIECQENKNKFQNSPSVYGSSPSRYGGPTSMFGGGEEGFSTVAPNSSVKRQGEDVMVCPLCMEPFVHLDDLQVHMISAHEGSMGQETATPMASESSTSTTAPTETEEKNTSNQ